MTEQRSLRVRHDTGDAPRILLVRETLATLAFVPTVLHFGWRQPVLDQSVLHAIQFVAVAAFAVAMFITMRRAGGREAQRRFLVTHWAEAALVVIAACLSWSWLGLALATSALMVVVSLRVYMLVASLAIPPGLVFVGSFLALIAVGTAGLMLPAATPPGQPIGVLDASFTITSAISQTGLVVRPTGESFTRFGQVVICAWIQIGALGILVFGAVVATMLGSSFGLRATQTLGETTEQGWEGQYSLGKLVLFIMIVTHAVEALGAAAYYFLLPATWDGAPPMHGAGDRVFHCVFLAVSSFCNAGFATTANSFEGLRTGVAPHTVAVVLTIIGLLGFPVLQNIMQVVVGKLRGRRTEGRRLIRLDTHTKIVLSTLAVVYLLGLLFVFIGETLQTDTNWRVAILDAHFLAAQRTTGFDTVSPADIGLFARLVVIFMMFIGGAPGSTAGGLKVVVLAILALTVWSTIRGRPQTEAWGRTIPDEVVRKCATILALCLGTCMITVAVLTATEHIGDETRLGPLLFETISAFGTSGLSTGITAELSAPGRVALMAAMFIGRVGALAIFAAVFSVRPAMRAQYAYPRGDVVIY
ncbi:MAG: hypothetical protein H6813_03340 [Phycisphaeraceae bacterium]|nr:hypothetical protein [Phycisphaeraceae bacterium]MCB9846980.1 hypothetical protein [Phycisphaeraceae bacterium]